MVAAHKPRARAVKDAQPRPKRKHEADVPGVKVEDKPPQYGIDDKRFTEPVLYEHIAEMKRMQSAVRMYNRHQKSIREAFSLMQGIKDGDRIIIEKGTVDDPPYIIRAKERSGGGFEIGVWTRVGVGTITKAE